MTPPYKNDKVLAELVAKELRRYASDFIENQDKLMEYWDTRNEQFEFKVWNREIKARMNMINE